VALPAGVKPRVVETPLGQLRKARAARGAALRAKYARAGLAQSPEDAETRWLLMRQLYISHLEADAFEKARDLAHDMITVFGEVEDVARFDLARALLALGEWEDALRQLTAAERVAPESRKWDHLFAAARVEGALGRPERALALLDGVGRSVVRLRKDPVVNAARVVWKSRAKGTSRRDALVRAYQRLSEVAPLPAVGEYFAAELLSLLGKPEASSVYAGFVRATGRLTAVARLSLAAEVFRARMCSRDSSV
jgi:tetratricopeptide (TPR) repeat protein